MVAWMDPKSLQSLEAVGAADRPHHQTSEDSSSSSPSSSYTSGGVIVRGEVVGKWYGDGETVGECAGAEKVEMRGDGTRGLRDFKMRVCKIEKERRKLNL
ncbi:hypothetical protein RIF29_16653 [Crotalaria pallida]|uniref:Uncharacterized protein n=1 Tax=Crotalaria pallida TaxID=3830 RepID=A0AAN9FFT3_CROPI